MTRKRIAIACQGGGSQCAFIAGALKSLFAHGIHRRYEITGLSGTSCGAIPGAPPRGGLLEQARGSRRPIEDRIVALWQDLSAQTPQELLLDNVCIQGLRFVETGLIPSFATSP